MNPILDYKYTVLDDVVFKSWESFVVICNKRYTESLDYFSNFVTKLLVKSKTIADNHQTAACKGIFPDISDYNDVTHQWHTLVRDMYYVQNKCMVTRHKFLRYVFPTHQMHKMWVSKVKDADILKWYTVYVQTQKNTLEFKFYADLFSETDTMNRFKQHEINDLRFFSEEIISNVESANKQAMKYYPFF